MWILVYIVLPTACTLRGMQRKQEQDEGGRESAIRQSVDKESHSRGWQLDFGPLE